MGVGLARALARAGWRVVVITSGADDGVSVDMYGVEVIRFHDTFRNPPHWMLGSPLRFLHGRRIIRNGENPAGVICSAPQYVPWARVAYPAAPVVFICHGMSAVDRLFSQPDQNQSQRMRCQMGIAAYLRDAQETLAYRLAHRTVALSQGMRQQLTRFSRVGVARIVQIPNGIDAQRIADRPARTLGGDLRVLYLGRLSRPKNVAYLLRALSALGLGTEWTCRLVGDGDQRAELQGCVSRLGMVDRVRFDGWVQDPREALLWANVFVLPSLWEGCSMAMLEAMAWGLPCIGLKYDGHSFQCDSSQMITNGENGFLVDGKSPACLGRALGLLADNPALRAEMGQQSRRRVLRDFDWSHVAEMYSRLIESLRDRSLTCPHNQGLGRSD